MPEFVSVGGTVFHVEHRRFDDRPHVVFCNSLGTDLRLWDAVVAGLGARVSTLRWDKQGHGLSGLARPDLALADHVDDLAGIMDHFGIARAVIAGDSIGGAIAQGLAAARPDLAAGLILLDTAARFGTPETWNARIAAVEAGGIAAIADTVMERWFSPAFRAAEPVRLAGWRAMLARSDAAGYIASCRALARIDLSATAAALALPVTVGAGAADGSTPPETVKALAALIPGSRFVLFEDVGHLPPVECPDDVAALIIGFIEENRLG